MTNPVNPNQLDMIQRVLKYHPEVAEAIAAVGAVTAKAKFPVESFHDLTEAMGGPDATIAFRGREFALSELEHQIPAYYFPIANVNDLIAKFGDLSKRMPTIGRSDTVRTVGGNNINAVFVPSTAPRPKEASPSLTLEEMHKASGYVQQPIPAIGGVPK